jgi:hypothetical protein
MAVIAVEVLKYQSNGIAYDTRDEAERAEFVRLACERFQFSSQMTPAEVLAELFDNRNTVMTMLKVADLPLPVKP